MTRHERIAAALKGEDVDRIPINVWMHHSAEDQDPRTLAETQVDYAEEFDFDFIKLMPFGLYSVQDYGAKINIYAQTGRPPVVADPGIHEVADWGRIEPLPAYYGSYGKQVQLARYAAAYGKKKFPIIQTIFSPLTTARKLAGDRILGDLKENPALFKQALEAITETTINFVKANIDAGVDGFFFATQCAVYDFCPEEVYREFGEFYDLKVIGAYKDKTFFNVVHPHGTGCMFELIANYPVPCINWHDRWAGPEMGKARTLTGKCLMGGLREVPFFDKEGKQTAESILKTGTPEELLTHVAEAVEAASWRKLIIGPGCVADQHLPREQLRAIRRTVDALPPKGAKA
ncbi:MAG: uroporphyrinogen decarboxylase [Treponema sp.]|nr:uroporphyrinogen decarboxylase [Treponema sp.]